MKTLPERVRTPNKHFQCLVKVWVNRDDHDDVVVEMSDNPAHEDLVLTGWTKLENIKNELQRKKLLRDA